MSRSVVTRVAARAPAKVNLHLAVGPRRPDGYHELTTVFHAIGLYDEVLAGQAAAGAGVTVAVRGEGAELVPTDRRNLAVRAATALAAAAGVAPDVRLEVTKAIPVAAGLAGGSADAAATLLACDALWASGLPRASLAEIASTLGSDVPFALAGGTALGVGRGDRLSPVLVGGQWHWVLAVADNGLGTPAVYAELDRLRAVGDPPPAGPPDEVINALRSGEPRALGAALANDLEPAALSLRPSLRRTLLAGRELGALGAIVSGSGPTCVFLARSAEGAIALAAALAGAGVCRTVRIADGPVLGARLDGER